MKKEIIYEGIHIDYMPTVAKIWVLTYANPFYTDMQITDFTFTIREAIVDIRFAKGFIADRVGYSLYMGSQKEFFPVSRRGQNGSVLFQYGALKEQFLFASYMEAKKFEREAVLGLKEYLEGWYEKAIYSLNKNYLGVKDKRKRK